MNPSRTEEHPAAEVDQLRGRPSARAQRRVAKTMSMPDLSSWFFPSAATAADDSSPPPAVASPPESRPGPDETGRDEAVHDGLDGLDGPEEEEDLRTTLEQVAKDYGAIPTQQEIRERRSAWSRLFLYITGLPPKEIRRKHMLTDNLSDQDIENKFTSLSLAFKTDKLTLANRLDLQLRQRDTSEKNIEEEIQQLKGAIENLNRVIVDSETRDVLTRLQQQVEVLRQTSERVSSSAEVYGAVQQEARISRAIDIMLAHVDNLKKIYEREHAELLDAKRVLAEHNLSMDAAMTSVDASSRTSANRVRSVSVIHNKSGVGDYAGGGGGSGGACAGQAPVRKLGLGLVSGGPPVRKTSLSSGVRVLSSLAENVVCGAESGAMGPIKEQVENGKSSASSGSPLPPLEENNNQSKPSPAFDSAPKTASATSAETGNGKSGSGATGNGDFSHIVRRNNNNRIRSRSLIEPVKEEDENALFSEIDQLAKKRDSSPAPLNFRSQLESIRKSSLIRDVLEWSRDLTWPWDWDETLLGLRYCLTGLLLFAAFMSLVVTFFGGGGGGGGDNAGRG